jgi:cytosine/adenosine deaminase-related metal-dependent hydrolase
VRPTVPGFVNAHTHLELTHFPSWHLKAGMDYHPRRFVDWIIQLIKVKRCLTVEDYKTSIHEGMRICLESGTTAIGEIVSNPAVVDSYDSCLLSGRLFYEVLGQDQTRFNSMLSKAVDCALYGTPEQFFSGLSPHAPYTIADAHYPMLSLIGQSANLPFAIHLSESEEETDFVFDSSGQIADVFYPYVSWERYLMPPRKCSSTDLLNSAGMLRPGTMAIHCVHVTRADAEILKKQGVQVVLCPRSNERLNVGKAPVGLLKKLGIPLSLGTDSLASNDSLSIWDEMRFALDTYQGALTPAELFRMATIGGASALGISAGNGALEIGKRADFQVVPVAGQPETSEHLLEWIVGNGKPEEVYVTGARYVGNRG